MKRINVKEITLLIEKMCQEANYNLPSDMWKALDKAKLSEVSSLGKNILEDIYENATIAKNEQIPICQDTGTAVVFLEMGQEVLIEGGLLEEAIQEGVRKGYKEGYLRKSIVENPLFRVNTGDNTPAIIHYQIVGGDNIKITLVPKGGGSENMSRVFMLTPSAGIKGVEQAVLDTVKIAGPNACLPMIVGIGLGGNFETCTLLAKKALTRDIGTFNQDNRMEKIERDLFDKINCMGIGPQGLGGSTTALAVHIEVAPCHIASMPLAINIGCHVNRHITYVI
ncbi:MAG: fumarate hydratase [Cellulosilyticaceae bacterium]